jgi:hypothetical protein
MWDTFHRRVLCLDQGRVQQAARHLPVEAGHSAVPRLRTSTRFGQPPEGLCVGAPEANIPQVEPEKEYSNVHIVLL